MGISKCAMGLVGGILLSVLASQTAGAAETTGTGEVEVTVGHADAKGQKHVKIVQELYKRMINQKQPKEVSKYLAQGYIQHNPTLPTGPEALVKGFEGIESLHPRAHVVVHSIIAVGDYAYAHVNFVNLFSDDPNDRGLAGVDIYRFDSEDLVAEHWDVLQPIPDPNTAANKNGMF